MCYENRRESLSRATETDGDRAMKLHFQTAEQCGFEFQFCLCCFRPGIPCYIFNRKQPCALQNRTGWEYLYTEIQRKSSRKAGGFAGNYIFRREATYAACKYYRIRRHYQPEKTGNKRNQATNPDGKSAAGRRLWLHAHPHHATHSDGIKTQKPRRIRINSNYNITNQTVV